GASPWDRDVAPGRSSVLEQARVAGLVGPPGGCDSFVTCVKLCEYQGSLTQARGTREAKEC
ncbi:hypothetical protein KFL_000520010, partial [Klebsormidium nitens]